MRLFRQAAGGVGIAQILDSIGNHHHLWPDAEGSIEPVAD